MAFINLSDWERIHYIDSPSDLISYIGPIEGMRVLDVGCGDGLMSLGLAKIGAAEVVGLDIKDVSQEMLSTTVLRLVSAGFADAPDYAPKVHLETYDGLRMPVEDDSFDVVMSWGVFEHVANVKRVLLEMKRAMKKNGVGFINVFPWFYSFYGSHLSDFVPAYAHLQMTTDEIRSYLLEYFETHSHPYKDLILGHGWEEYLTLNKYSADMFYRDFRSCGFSSHIWTPLCYPQELNSAPENVEFSDLIICGGRVVFRK